MNKKIYIFIFFTVFFTSNVIAETKWQIIGESVSELNQFDETMKQFMLERNISQGALALARNGNLLFAKGYSLGEETEVTKPTSLFRIASISKPITATAIMTLVESGLLNLDDTLTDILELDQVADSNLSQITIKHLLQHTAGWDRGVKYNCFDPMFGNDIVISDDFGIALPITQTDIIKYMNQQNKQLQHSPGTFFAIGLSVYENGVYVENNTYHETETCENYNYDTYSNYGYMLLGRVIEKIANKPYEEYVKQAVLTPLNLRETKLGKTLKEFRLPNEVEYKSIYQYSTVMDSSNSNVSAPYGSFNIENMDSHGGWVSSVIEMALFATLFDYPDTNLVLSSASIENMFAAPDYIKNYNLGDYYYGLGWDIRLYNGYRNTWHSGSLPGTYTFMVRWWDEISLVVFFNQRDDVSGLDYFLIDPVLGEVVVAIETWPEHDFFDYYISQSTLPESIESYVIMNENDELNILSGDNVLAFGSLGVNVVNISRQGRIHIVNAIGSNQFNIQESSSVMTIYRSGATVYLKSINGTLIQIPATLTKQIVRFYDGSTELFINDGKVYFGEQVVKTNECAISTSIDSNDSSKSIF